MSGNSRIWFAAAVVLLGTDAVWSAEQPKSSGAPATQSQASKLAFDTYSGYFVSNQFEPNAAESFLVIDSQGRFDGVFGVAMVMGDKSHRLPKDVFKSAIVLAAIKRGKTVWEYTVQGATETGGVVELRYAASGKQSESATFACPLIVSIPKGSYKAVVFVENEKIVKRIEIGPRKSGKHKPVSSR
jgi:hypothetical protein